MSAEVPLTVYRVSFSVFCPTETVPTWFGPAQESFFIFFASARATIYGDGLGATV
jgi:hypothetical protein